MDEKKGKESAEEVWEEGLYSLRKLKQQYDHFVLVVQLDEEEQKKLDLEVSNTNGKLSSIHQHRVWDLKGRR